MDSKRIIKSSSSSSLLFRGNAESHSQHRDSSDDVASPTLTFTTLVVVFGSYVKARSEKLLASLFSDDDSGIYAGRCMCVRERVNDDDDFENCAEKYK